MITSLNFSITLFILSLQITSFLGSASLREIPTRRPHTSCIRAASCQCLRLSEACIGWRRCVAGIFHYLAHSPSRLGFVFGEKAINDAGSDECSASAFHIAHSHGETVACVFYSLFVKPCEVVVCATHSLRAIVCAACFFADAVSFLLSIFCCGCDDSTVQI